MKKNLSKIIIAFALYFLGIAKIIDWLIFCSQNRALKEKDYPIFITKYETKFPTWLQPLFNTRPDLAAIISVVFFAISGMVFINQKNLFYKILGATAFLFSFWNLFSLM